MSRIDGEFLILHAPPARDFLRVVSSRFGYPVFWMNWDDTGNLVASTAFADVWDRLVSQGKQALSPEAIFDAFLFKRIFGDKTLDRNTRLLQPARHWLFDGKGVREHPYWQPDYRLKTQDSLDTCADTLIDLVKSSIRCRTGDNKRYGLFLSGGMDTRLLAAVFASEKTDVNCITINAFENREVRTAQAVAKVTGFPHTFLETPPGHYHSTLPEAVRLSAGMHNPMCMFHGHAQKIADIADAGFHGHGFDFMFQGMYIPARNPELFGRTLAWKRMAEIPADPDDLIDYFFNTISYRLRGLNVLTCGKPVAVGREQERIKSELRAILDHGRKLSDSAHDWYEYLTFSNMARHYSVGDHWGINTSVEQRTIAFSNDIYDFYRALPVRHRFDARIQRRALRRLSPKLAQLPSANHTFPMGISSAERTVREIGAAIRRRINPFHKTTDNRFERMGLPFHYLAKHDWKQALEELSASERLETLDFLDVGKVQSWAKQAVNGDDLPDGQFLTMVMSLDQFLKNASA